MNDSLSDSQTQAPTASFGTAMNKSTIKPLENMGQMLAGNSVAVIPKLDAYLTIGPFERYHDFGVRRRILDSVIQKDDREFMKQRLIPRVRHILAQIAFNLNALGRGQRSYT
jgi:hypothetical protein